MSTVAACTDVAQAAPPVGLDLAGFPDGGRFPARAFRAHLGEFDPWHFASHPAGRFNLAYPNGTCYFAAAVSTAVREFYGPKVRRNEVSAADAAVLRVSTITPPTDATSADVSGAGAAPFGVTSELTTMGDFTITRAWAELFKDHVDGLRYRSRFDPGGEAWALFGIAGPAPSLGGASAIIDGEHAVAAAGMSVLPGPPRKSAVRMVPDPPG
ncbi:RES family NAD+ phosphorylase [Curtobacterium sp. VKM Ac-1393]|uniref:RES family NAD+ phosphorylase n=1 Tax=Curtobacterium sp. VKM Ac-1393 TaxID=2783814 RepID=UPI00188D2B6E|nr:RES family NAD+ phosphorylase [Curtobacterium sp. VKM Ac-1393]MBF4607661.1 RES family NAD+ phosphorylase [Curtobacterium sp. VKM Ac-1393]